MHQYFFTSILYLGKDGNDDGKGAIDNSDENSECSEASTDDESSKSSDEDDDDDNDNDPDKNVDPAVAAEAESLRENMGRIEDNISEVNLGAIINLIRTQASALQTLSSIGYSMKEVCVENDISVNELLKNKVR